MAIGIANMPLIGHAVVGKAGRDTNVSRQITRRIDLRPVHCPCTEFGRKVFHEVEDLGLAMFIQPPL